MLVESEMEPGHGSLGHRVTVSAILTGSGRVTGQCVRSMFDQVLSFNMRVYRGVVSTEQHNLGKLIAA